MGVDPPPAVSQVAATARAVPGVVRVTLTGSGTSDDRTALSDWDFDLDVARPEVLGALEDAMQGVPTLAVFWDPLSTRANLIVLLDGPIKVDLIVPDAPNPAPIVRWEVSAATLPRLDAHFWDWTLWLGAKQLRGRGELVAAELAKMRDALLDPLGAAPTPTDIGATVDAYLAARDARASEQQVQIDHRLEHQVRQALTAAGVSGESSTERHRPIT